MTRRPPRSTLFPTRRSSDLLGGCAFRDQGGDATGGQGRRPRAGGNRDRGRRPRPPVASPDRKSTRLNSSHVSISYAVFCLKKKKKKIKNKHISENKQT